MRRASGIRSKAELLALALAMAACWPSFGQPPTGRFEAELDVQEVLLDVLVTDADGNVIVGLGAEDFVVEEEGSPVAIKSVSFYSNRRFLGAGETETAGEEPAEDRYFALFFYRPAVAAGRDNRLLLRLPQAGRDAFEWTVSDLLPNDHVAVLGFDTRLRLHQDFSRDRERLGRALAAATRGGGEETRWPSRMETPVAGISLAGISLAGISLAGQPALANPGLEVDEALAALAEALAEVKGRKNLVLFGVDLPASGATAGEDPFAAVVAAMNQSNVAVYTVAVTRRGHQETLDHLARETGGEYLFRFQSFLEPLRHVARVNSGYYLLSFESPGPRGGSGYRRLTVRTRDTELSARARGGYWFGERSAADAVRARP